MHLMLLLQIDSWPAVDFLRTAVQFTDDEYFGIRCAGFHISPISLLLMYIFLVVKYMALCDNTQ